MTTVLCHGVWDTLHPGHLRHLAAAKALGDTLVVSVTSDRFVNKGPGRPVFNQGERMGQLEALEMVDQVVLSDAGTAASVIERVAPKYFVKGADYPTLKDLAPAERRAVVSTGAEFHSLATPTDSSSRVGNRAYATYPEETERWLKDFRSRWSESEIIGALDSIKGMRVLVVGELIDDRYSFVEPLAKSPRENFMSSKWVSRQNARGGSAAVQKHLKGIVDNPVMVSQSQAIIKERFVHGTTKLFGVQSIPDPLLEDGDESNLVGFLERNLDLFNVVMVTDYGHGFFTPKIKELVEQGSKFLAVVCQTNSANYGFNLVSKWDKPDYLSMDRPEYNLAVANGWDAFGQRRLMITDGAKGCDFAGHHIPALGVNVVDRVGAGDALFAFTAPLVAAGVEPEIVAFIGSCAAAMQCEVVGNDQPVDPVVLRKFIKRLMS